MWTGPGFTVLLVYCEAGRGRPVPTSSRLELSSGQKSNSKSLSGSYISIVPPAHSDILHSDSDPNGRYHSTTPPYLAISPSLCWTVGVSSMSLSKTRAKYSRHPVQLGMRRGLMAVYLTRDLRPGLGEKRNAQSECRIVWWHFSDLISVRITQSVSVVSSQLWRSGGSGSSRWGEVYEVITSPPPVRGQVGSWDWWGQ